VGVSNRIQGARCVRCGWERLGTCAGLATWREGRQGHHECPNGCGGVHSPGTRSVGNTREKFLQGLVCAMSSRKLPLTGTQTATVCLLDCTRAPCAWVRSVPSRRWRGGRDPRACLRNRPWACPRHRRLWWCSPAGVLGRRRERDGGPQSGRRC